MRHSKRKKTLKPSSYIILAELAEASRLFEAAIEKGGNLKAGTEEFDRISAAAAAFRLEVDPVQRSDSRVVLFNIPELQRFLHVFLSPTHHSAFSDIYRHTFKNVR